MKRLMIFFVILFLTSAVKSQENLDEAKAKNAVGNYLKTKKKDYVPGNFGEVFVQNYGPKIQEELNSDEEISYSVVHSYKLGGKEYNEMYFHLDKTYKVLGSLTKADMIELTNKIIEDSRKMDSLLNSISPP